MDCDNRILYYKSLYPSKHFIQRCSERGIQQCDIRELFSGIVWAVNENKDNYCEYIKKAKNGADWYRINTLDGIFYVPVFLQESINLMVPATIYNIELWTKQRKNEKTKKKKSSRRKRTKLI
jgi:hypothetical protein